MNEDKKKKCKMNSPADTKKYEIGQINGYSVSISFSDNGMSLENLVKEYVNEKMFIY